MPTDLAGRKAIVTGGGRGIGRAICLALARQGTDVTVVARTESEIQETARLIEDEGRNALALPCDAAEEAQVNSVIAGTLERFGAIDILIANHGMILSSPVWKTPVDDWDRVMAVNLRGVFLFVRAVIPHLIERGAGVIVGVSSTAGLRGYQAPTTGAYVASKAGLIALDQQLDRKSVV